MASISARRMRSALSTCDGSGTTMVAVVPRARNEQRSAMQDRADATAEAVIGTCRPR